MSIKISIITVCLNAEDTIKDTIITVNEQTYPNIEHIFIDGDSTDNTLEIIKKYSVKNKIISEKDSGIYNAMNKGIKIAEGEIIFFLNADDYFCDINVVQDMITKFIDNPKLEAVYGNITWDIDGNLVKQTQPSEITRRYLARKTILHQSLFVRKKLFDFYGYFSEFYKVVSDYEWILRIFLNKNINYKYINRDIAVMNTKGISWTTDWEAERLDVMKKYFNFLEIILYRMIPMKCTTFPNLF